MLTNLLRCLDNDLSHLFNDLSEYKRLVREVTPDRNAARHIDVKGDGILSAEYYSEAVIETRKESLLTCYKDPRSQVAIASLCEKIESMNSITDTH